MSITLLFDPTKALIHQIFMQVISFYLSYLEREIVRDSSLLFIDPSTTYLLTLSGVIRLFSSNTLS